VVEIENSDHLVRRFPAPHNKHPVVFKAEHVHLVLTQTSQGRTRSSKSNEFTMKIQQYPMLVLAAQVVIEPGPEKRLLILRIGRIRLPVEVGELGFAAATHGIDQSRI